MAPIEVKHYIDGEFVSSSDNATFDLLSPYNKDLVAKVPEATTADVDRAVASAKTAFPSWSALSPQERGKPLKKLAALLEAERDELARLDAISVGRPVDAFFDDFYAATHFNYFAEAAYALGTSSLNTPGFVNVSLRQPYGVGAAIIPWNAPLVFFSKKLAPALAAGNTMVIKTSEKAPLSCYRASQLLAEAGFPPGVVHVLHGHGAVAGAAIASHMDIRALSFTGSVRTGRAIQRAAALSNFKHLVFELGGKSPAVIFADADIERAAQETAYSVFWHNGQTCMASSRVLVHEDVAARFVELFGAAAAKRRYGDPRLEGVDNGPVADRAQFEAVERYVQEGRASGEVLELEAGRGAEGEALFVRPTIFLEQPADAKVVKEEIFGPVVCVNKFKTEEEALRLANDTEYGLYASVYTKDIDRAMRFAKGLESGMVGINCTSPTGAWDMPFGGVKQSGVGRESLVDSLNDWTEVKSVFIKVDGLLDPALMPAKTPINR